MEVPADGAEVDTIRLREGGDLRHFGRVPARGLAHRGVDGVARLGESLGGQTAEAAGRAGDEYDLAHHGFPCGWAPIRKRGRSCVWVQMIPPLARSVWPLIQAPSGPARKATVAAMSAGWPRRSNGASLAKRSTTSCGLPCRNRSVAVGPGATALTVMLRPRSSLARMLVIASTAALVPA